MDEENVQDFDGSAVDLLSMFFPGNQTLRVTMAKRKLPRLPLYSFQATGM